MFLKKWYLLTFMRPDWCYHLPDFFRSDIKFISLSKSVAFETNFWWFLAKSPSYTFHSCSYQHNIFFLKIANYEAPVIFDLEKAFCLQQTYLYTRTASWPVWVALASPPVQECSQCPHHWNHGQPPLILLEPLERKKTNNKSQQTPKWNYSVKAGTSETRKEEKKKVPSILASTNKQILDQWSPR